MSGIDAKDIGEIRMISLDQIGAINKVNENVEDAWMYALNPVHFDTPKAEQVRLALRSYNSSHLFHHFSGISPDIYHTIQKAGFEGDLRDLIEIQAVLPPMNGVSQKNRLCSSKLVLLAHRFSKLRSSQYGENPWADLASLDLPTCSCVRQLVDYI